MSTASARAARAERRTLQRTGARCVGTRGECCAFWHGLGASSSFAVDRDVFIGAVPTTAVRVPCYLIPSTSSFLHKFFSSARGGRIAHTQPARVAYAHSRPAAPARSVAPSHPSRPTARPILAEIDFLFLFFDTRAARGAFGSKLGHHECCVQQLPIHRAPSAAALGQPRPAFRQRRHRLDAGR